MSSSLRSKIHFVVRCACSKITAGRVQNAFRLSGRAGSVKNEKRMFAVEFFSRTICINRRHQLVPPVIAAGFHVNLAARSFDDDARFDGRSFFQRFIDRRFQFHFIAAPPAAVRGDDDFALRIVDAIDQRACSRNRRRQLNASRQSARRPASRSPAQESAACKARRDRLFRRPASSGRWQSGRLQ